jgi:ubiquinone/menaquinone biosynthesis C-methylase UbiE
MQRVPEPELMQEDLQAEAYARADFEEPHSNFLKLFRQNFPHVNIQGFVLDLGCGPGDISIRFARAFPKCTVHGVDGSEAMLNYGRLALGQAVDVQERVQLFKGLLPDLALPRTRYDAVISNSLLHHLHDPQVMWRTVGEFAASATRIFIMDLIRPKTVEEARKLVETHVGSEPAVLQRDFFNSLLAAFEPAEIEEQLRQAGLKHLSVSVVSDRHAIIFGHDRRNMG